MCQARIKRKRRCSAVFIPSTRNQTNQQRRVQRVSTKQRQSHVYLYNRTLIRIGRSPNSSLHHHNHSSLLPFPFTCPLILPYTMAPKPASTAGKAPASTASKAPAKSTEGAKAAKKTSKAAAPADGEKKKRKKVRKETYSSYIYKGKLLSIRSWLAYLIIL